VNPVLPTRVIGGRYVVLAELGRGGMGVVWRAEDRVMGRHVAVKELHLPEGLSPEDRRRFRDRLLREARTAGRLNDPGIVTVHDVITDNGVDHIVMELIEAPTLTDVVARSGPLDEVRTLHMAQQLLSALRAAHERGVVHRDVKPSNVMIDGSGHVTLTDFGIAQAVDDPRLTTTGAVIGSPGYLAPERLDGEAAPPASDLWSLGATLFYALTGSGPFARETTAATIAAVLNAEVPAVRTRGPLGAVIAGLLQRRPEVRLTAVQAQALLSGEPATPPTGQIMTRTLTSNPQAAGPRVRRWPALLGVLALGLAVGLGAGLLWPRGTAGPVAYTYGDGGEIPVWELSKSYCGQGQVVANRQFPSGSYVACDKAHDFEVFDSGDVLDTTHDFAYPGRDALAAVATSSCRLVFDSSLITGDDKATLKVTVLVPSQTAFVTRSSPEPGASYRDRRYFCVLAKADGTQLTTTRIAKDG
jgi:eukaryotic-like serine/threonine-protein kinase